MNRNRLLVVAAVGFAALLPASAGAQTQADLAISASVAANCKISTTPVAFGAYDPLGLHATAPLDASGGVVVACTKGSIPTIELDLGAHASGTTRQMSNGASGVLPYQLYRANDYVSIWGTGGNALAAPAAPSKAARTFEVFGRVAPGQDPATGTYSDTVKATVNF